MDYTEAVYHFLRENADRDEETGELVTRAWLHPWLMETFGLAVAQASLVRKETTKELESQGRVCREGQTPIVWILD